MNTTGKELPQVEDAEIALIKRTFLGNEDLLKSIRSLFLGLPLTSGEKASIKMTFQAPDLLAVMKRRFNPQIEKDTPIGTLQDAWLGVTDMVFGQPRDTIEQAVQYKDLALKYTAQALALLENPEGKQLDILNYSPMQYPNDYLQINMMARNQFIRHVENQLTFLKVIASQKDKTPEEVRAATKKDSSQ